MKYLWLLLFLVFTTTVDLSAADVKVELSGLDSQETATLTISSPEYLATIKATEPGVYVFHDVPVGEHFVKAEASGYNVIEALRVVVDTDGNVSPATALKIAVTKKSIDPTKWNFEWKHDGSTSGYITTSHINKPVEIIFLGKKIIPADVSSFGELENKYKVLLSNDEKDWTQEHAYRLVETFKILPIEYSSLKPAKFILTSDHLQDDIIVNDLGDGYEVKISEDAFYYANPFLVSLDGVRGRLFSKRLHHAITNFVTEFGKNTERADQILFNRFGTRIFGIDYETLTRGITDEDASCFQQFKPSEIVSIINILEELPEGFHKIPNLKYLIRRADGHLHPIYPSAAAVSWCVDNGYIEFMESAFGGNNLNFDTLRLILHEKSHFLWKYVFSEELKNAWIEIGGWQKDLNSPSGWSTTKDTEFVTLYAHEHNPDEDMAESIAFYLKDPEKLMSRSTDKYNFIRDRIMHGVRYITSIPDHLSFEVLNLWPDYDFPGKIKRVTVSVDGEADQDKLVTMEIELNHVDGLQDGATHAITRISSPSFSDKNGTLHGQFADIHFSPVDNNPHILQGKTQISKYSKMGHWTAGDIRISDLQGNERYEGRNDCVVDIYVNNPLEDLEPAVYEEGSLKYELTDSQVEGHHCQNLKVSYKLSDNIGISKTFARIYAEEEGFNTGGTGLTDSYGTFDHETGIAEVNFLIPDYFPTTYYYIPFIEFYDKADTPTRIEFSESPKNQPLKKIFIQTSHPDRQHPEVDLNRISVYAEPTNPEAPNGETKVTVNFYAKDDISGLGPCRYTFVDPQGVFHGNWYYHRNFYTTFFDGDPSAWEHYQIIHILPAGSAPGRWGLAMLQVSDKACNEFTYNFMETLIFEPDDNTSDYELFADVKGDNIRFNINSSSESTSACKWRVIHEDLGIELNGEFNPLSTRSKPNDVIIDVSQMPAGDLILIVNALDESGSTKAIKTRRLKYSKEIVAEGISLNLTSASIRDNETLQLTATVTPDDTTDKTITWTSSDNTIADVSETGYVSAHLPGKVTITATSVNGLTATCDVTVTKFAGINSILYPDEIKIVGNSVEAPEGSAIYDLQGRKTHFKNLDKGIFIVKLPDNTAVKIIIK